MSFQRLEIRDNQETVKRKIRQASASMFVREFTQNAVEAAKEAGPHGRVKWWQFSEGDARKLCVWNNGRGMTADELQHVMHLFSSGPEKTQAADGNFGIGAKITGLKASPAGVVYRSCKNGQVMQVELKWHGDVPGFEGPYDATEFYRDVRLDRFDPYLYRQLGRANLGLLDFDWTMAIFVGRSIEQDTVVDPFGDGSPDGGKSYWLFKAHNRRFYDFGSCYVTAIVNSNGERGAQSRQCQGLYHIPVEREETVEFPDGKIRYCLLPEDFSRNNEDASGYTAHGALVFKNEVYDGHFGTQWIYHGRHAGVIASANRIAIQVVLSEDFPATPNEQRTSLESESEFAIRTPIQWHDFDDDVDNLMPDWLREFISIEDAKKICSSDKQSKAIKRLMAEMGLTAKSQDQGDEPIALEDGEGEADVIAIITRRNGRGGGGSGGEEGTARPRPPRPPFKRGPEVKTGALKNLSSEPTVKWDKGNESTLIGFYDAKTHHIQLNESYPLLKNVTDKVMESGVPERYRDRVVEEARNQIGIAAATHILWALTHVSKHEWNQKQAEAALTQEALTASLGFYGCHYSSVEQQCRVLKSLSLSRK